MQETPPVASTDNPRPRNGEQDLHRDIVYPILGKLAIDNDLLTKEQLRQAISEMRTERSMGRPVPLEEILLSHGYIQPVAMEKLLASTLRTMDRQFCSLSQEMGILDSATCEMALSEQAEAYKKGKLIPVSDILIKKGMLTLEQRDEILSRMRQPQTAPPPKEDPIEAWKAQEKKRELTKSTIKISPEEMATANMALQYKFITTEQLQTAISHRSAAQKTLAPKDLNQSLFDLGFVSRKQISLFRTTSIFHETRQMDQMFGRLCILRGFCTEDDIHRALDTQLAKFKRNRTIKLIGDILVEAGALSPEQMRYILREQKRIPAEDTHESALVSLPSPPFLAQNTGLYVEISENDLKAQLIPAPKISPETDLHTLLQIIKDAGVVFGLIPKKDLEAYLEDPEGQQAAFDIAHGIPPTDPEDGYIRYSFDVDYLKVGLMDAKGNIDYFNRGETPFVETRTLLAERIPPKEGRPGMKVTGDEAPAREARDVELRSGKGAELSLDGQRVHALIDGWPCSTLGGKISVFPEMTIEGDVDLKTGHVFFQGIVHVRGSVQPGFKVEAAAVTATSVAGADITVSGDLVVKDGIIDSRIQAGGMVQAKFIVDSEILSFGSILVAKEIINSIIRTSGTLLLPKGTLIASEVAVRAGVEIYNIGTEVSVPCRIFMGANFHTKRETRRLREESALLKKEIEEKQKAIEAEKSRQIALHKEIAEKAQLQDNQQGMRKKLSIVLSQNKAKAEAIGRYIAQVEEEYQETETAITKLFTEQDKVLEQILKIHAQIETLTQNVEEFSNEYQALQAWSKANPPIPMLKLKGTIMPGTFINGPKSYANIKKKIENAIFTEMQITDSEGDSNWTIHIQNK